MKFRCKECGKEFSEKFPYCPGCGTKMVYPEEIENVEAIKDEYVYDADPIVQPKREKPEVHRLANIGFVFSLIGAIGVVFAILIVVLFCTIPALYSENADAIIGLAYLVVYGGAFALGMSEVALPFSIIGMIKSKNKGKGIAAIVLSASTFVVAIIAYIVAIVYAAVGMVSLFALFALIFASIG